jgi:hypothetical protein
VKSNSQSSDKPISYRILGACGIIVAVVTGFELRAANAPPIKISLITTSLLIFPLNFRAKPRIEIKDREWQKAEQSSKTWGWKKRLQN